MRLVFARAARRDLDDIVSYIALDDPAAAEQVFRRIESAGRHLLEFPGIGRPGRLSGTREFPIPGLPYMIVYTVGTDMVTIVAVFHGARDLPAALAQRNKEHPS